MTSFLPLTETFSVSAQIQESDLQRAADEGVVCIIMNRPEGEEPGQPETEALKAKARALGLDWKDIPIASGNFTPDAIEETARVIAATSGKIHAFCRSGTRSCFLWAFAEAKNGTLDLDSIIQLAAKASYDLHPALPMLSQFIKSRA